MDQQNRISWEISPHMQSLLISDKSSKVIWWGKESVQMELEQLDMHMQNKTLKLYLIPYIKIKFKWILELHVKNKTIKSVQWKQGKNICDLGLGFFLYKPAKVQTNEKNDKWNCIKINICSSKDSAETSHRLVEYVKNDKGFVSIICK